MIAAGITLWFILGVLGVALDFSNPCEDDMEPRVGRVLMGLFGPFWFLLMLLWLVLNPAPVRKREDQ